MLELKGIRKEYPAGDGRVEALKGIDLQFRKSEFVSILGPSGCGKTTMLNIIGGLDGYTEGDLIINGTSTKEYKDRDWDSYRNHSVGFVFQSYNLIPHQTVLQNVEIALTLSGVSKAERKERAKKALEEVGLGDQLYKKPNAMSGGQMQRVAIARALVNNPDIILADEPTGALDTETSVQVMEILKNISKDRLIVMVTHNPELAEQYSSRIIRMLDGKITGDSQPLTDEEIKRERELCEKEKVSSKKVKKPSMSFATSFMLSLKNLFTKKGRTTLTAFAGSIGIIGIALILAVSTGMTTYIDTVQENTLSSYPLTLEATTVELSTLMETFMNLTSEEKSHDTEAVYKKSALYDMMNALNNLEQQENDLKSFKEFLETEMAKKDSKLSEAINGIGYAYNLDMQIYTKNVDGAIIPSNTEEILHELILKYMNIDMAAMQSSMESMGVMSSMSSSMNTMQVKLWQEMLTGNDGDPINDLLKEQYDVIYGSWPNSYDEIVLVVDENNELDDITLYALGLLPEESIESLMDAAMNGTQLDVEETKWSYEEICNMEFKTVLNADCYAYDEATGLYTDLRETEAGLRYLYDNALTLKVTGIIRPNEDAGVTMLTGNIGYTKMLTEYLIEKAEGTAVIEAQLANPTKDVLTGLPFDSSTGSLSDAEKEKAFREYIASLSDSEKAATYIAIKSIPSNELVQQQVDAVLGTMTREQIEAQMAQAMGEQMSVNAEEIAAYLANMTDEELKELIATAITEQVKAQYAAEVAGQMAAMTPEQLVGALTMEMETYKTEECAAYYDEVLVFSESTYEDNLLAMGYIDMESPAAINIYASSFENKDIITDAIADYNKNVEDIKQIKYTDYVGIMMSSITTIIDAITYVLIAFVAISLVVSSIMIGVITLISVQERTKEIGILRAIGASKKNVSRMFNAETMIVGFSAGLLGVVVTYILCIPINMILHEVTGIGNLSAMLPVPAAAILVGISVILTLISGIIPSRSAAKKDPVVALRTE
ncbi:MAG: ABC transporter ATP-binding protein/permease [Lachnospiraceae bacterium]|nr:ABC transporter ATP-binding protein/permease [Lachnospiraceae bacterium]